jgi:hypothetical protein
MSIPPAIHLPSALDFDRLHIATCAGTKTPLDDSTSAPMYPTHEMPTARNLSSASADSLTRSPITFVTPPTRSPIASVSPVLDLAPTPVNLGQEIPGTSQSNPMHLAHDILSGRPSCCQRTARVCVAAAVTVFFSAIALFSSYSAGTLLAKKDFGETCIGFTTLTAASVVGIRSVYNNWANSNH